MQRIGVWCWHRRVLVVGLWLLAMAGGAVAIGPLFAGMGDTTTLPGTETGRAQAVIDAAIDHGEQFFAVVDNVDAGSAATTAALAGAADDIRAITGVSSVDGPIAATDGRAATVIITLAPAESQYQPFTDAQARWSELTAALPGATVSVGGGDLIGDEANAAVQDDLRNAEIYSLPLTLILLLLIFGGVAAAALPAVAAIATMLGATAVLLGFASVVTIDANAITVVTLLGLGLSIDYGLLLVARFRDELTRTGDRIEAVAAAWHTAGRTIGFSALTVVAALAGLMAFDVGELRALAAAGIATVIVAMLAGITLTAALLGFVGRWIKPRQRHGRTQADSGFFAGLARRTQRRPWLTLAGCAVVLLALAAPLLHVIIKVPQLEGLPRTLESVQVADVLDQRFGISSQAGVAVLARTDPATLDGYAQPWAADPAVARVEPASAVGAGVSMVVLDVHGDGQGAGAQALVDRLRQDRPAGYESWVTGDAARLMDLQDRLIDGLPLAAAIVVLSMLIVLFLMTGSVVVGVKAIVVSALSLAATFGVLTGRRGVTGCGGAARAAAQRPHHHLGRAADAHRLRLLRRRGHRCAATDRPRPVRRRADRRHPGPLPAQPGADDRPGPRRLVGPGAPAPAARPDRPARSRRTAGRGPGRGNSRRERDDRSRPKRTRSHQHWDDGAPSCRARARAGRVAEPLTAGLPPTHPPTR